MKNSRLYKLKIDLGCRDIFNLSKYFIIFGQHLGKEIKLVLLPCQAKTSQFIFYRGPNDRVKWLSRNFNPVIAMLVVEAYCTFTYDKTHTISNFN